MTRTFTLTAAILGLIGVGLGAFGAHGLKSLLEANGQTSSFDTATQYLFIHALALLMVAILNERKPSRILNRAGALFIAGAILFCGALYLLAIFNLKFMGALAPIGGLALIGGWGSLALAAWRKP